MITRRVYLASDHAGFALKQALLAHLASLGLETMDLGAHNQESCDYPDFAHRLCAEVTATDGYGILICGTGIGISITANRHAGIRAALCTHEFHAEATRAHNNANVLCLGERVTASGLACRLAEIFLSTPFEGGRHQRRIERINAVA